MENKHPFEHFLGNFTPKAAKLQRQVYKLLWIMETTGSSDAADLKAELEAEFKLLFHDKDTYARLLDWEKDPFLNDPLLKRQLHLILIEFKKNQIPEELLRLISEREAQLSMAYTNFRSKCDGKSLTENEIRKVLSEETNPEKRKKVWEASKEIGRHLAPLILELVILRNTAAQSLGYSDYFQMQLELQDVDVNWLLETFEILEEESATAYDKTLDTIAQWQEQRFHVAKEELGPWAWSDPFCQEDPIQDNNLDHLLQDHDFIEIGRQFFGSMGFDVDAILKRSDMYEREGKNQHAFCINIDREQDIRTLNNIRPTLKWLEVILHELGHAVYELGYDASLPWLLKKPPHMLVTEAMALICGRQAYRAASLKQLLPNKLEYTESFAKAEQGLRRRQLIFSRWVIVMTAFESALYQNPAQDLNQLWWALVEKHQKISAPSNREGACDWAAKYHIGMAPAYYFSYLLGEMLASTFEQHLPKGSNFNSTQVGDYFKERLFRSGSIHPWHELVKRATNAPLTSTSWTQEFS
ncbi:MAG: M2 family metallopeptidase [Chlamydiota bacterium]